MRLLLDVGKENKLFDNFDYPQLRIVLSRKDDLRYSTVSNISMYAMATMTHKEI